MAISLPKLLQRLGVQLRDEAGRDWDGQELLDYLHEGVQLLPVIAPERFTRTAAHTLVAGAEQRLERAEVRRLLGVRGLTPFDLATMDAVLPTWREAAPAAPRQAAVDPVDPYVFWVYPPAPADAEITVQYIEHAPAVTDEGETLALDASFEQALVDYALARAYGKDAEYAGEDARAAYHKAQFAGGGGG